jgi:sucrose-6-phosphate hydrolase SacC (GH32 family)
MLEAFDPYHKWLGIPPSQQPPTHYRLLGLEPFETDRDVIDAAANQRMSYLQDSAAGPHGDKSQRLLNEVSAARRCLLNPTAKEKYDATLRAKVTPTESVPVTTTSDATEVIEPQPFFFEQPEFEPEPKPKMRPEVGSPSSRLPLGWIIGGVVAVLGVVGLIFAFQSGGEPTPEQVKVPEKQEKKPKEATEKKPLADPLKNDPKNVEPKKVETKKTPPAKNLAPLLHFAPAGQTLSELCELVQAGNDYHLFYLSHPPGQAAKQSWGHAISSDLVHWREEAISFPIGDNTLPGTVAWAESSREWTAIVPTRGKAPEPVFRLLTSSDGKNWSLEMAPLDLPKLAAGRNRPRLCRDKAGKRWLLTVSAHSGDPKGKNSKAQLYASEDLRKWALLTEFELADPSGIVGLYRFPLVNKKDQFAWCVLNEAGKIQVVDFNGTGVKMLPTAPLSGLDWGPRTGRPRLAQLADGRSIMMAWSRAERDAPNTPTNLLTLPYEFRVGFNDKGGYYFHRFPTKEFDSIRKQIREEKWNPSVKKNFDPLPEEPYELFLELVSDKDDAKLDITFGGFDIKVQEKAKRLSVNDLNLPIGFYQKKFTLRIIVDQSTLTVWGNTVPLLTRIVPPDNQKDDPLRLNGSGVQIAPLRVYTLK